MGIGPFTERMATLVRHDLLVLGLVSLGLVLLLLVLAGVVALA